MFLILDVCVFMSRQVYVHGMHKHGLKHGLCKKVSDVQTTLRHTNFPRQGYVRGMREYGLCMEVGCVKSDLVPEGGKMPSDLLAYSHFEVWIIAIHETCMSMCVCRCVCSMCLYVCVCV
jgi:hypothetical protein